MATFEEITAEAERLAAEFAASEKVRQQPIIDSLLAKISENVGTQVGGQITVEIVSEKPPRFILRCAKYCPIHVDEPGGKLRFAVPRRWARPEFDKFADALVFAAPHKTDPPKITGMKLIEAGDGELPSHEAILSRLKNKLNLAEPAST